MGDTALRSSRGIVFFWLLGALLILSAPRWLQSQWGSTDCSFDRGRGALAFRISGQASRLQTPFCRQSYAGVHSASQWCFVNVETLIEAWAGRKEGGGEQSRVVEAPVMRTWKPDGRFRLRCLLDQDVVVGYAFLEKLGKRTCNPGIRQTR